MATIAELLHETLRAAQASQWSAHRQGLAALGRALAAATPAADEELRVRLEMLNCASPEHDREGYLGELEELAALLEGESAPQGPVAAHAEPIDLRGLKPPEPIVRIFRALELSPDEPLRVVLPHEPAPLYALLRERGFSCTGSRRADGGYELLIERS